MRARKQRAASQGDGLAPSSRTSAVAGSPASGASASSAQASEAAGVVAVGSNAAKGGSPRSLASVGTGGHSPAAMLEQRLYREIHAKAASASVSAGSFARSEFKKLDFDGNGNLDAEEFNSALSSIGVTMSEVEVALLMSHLDGDGDGIISIDEFVHRILDTQLKHVQAKLRAASYTLGGVNLPALFKHYDRDNSGELEFDEFRQAVRRGAQLVASVVADSELKTLFNYADGDGDGTIDLAEFVELLTPDASIAEQAKERCDSEVGQMYARILAKAEERMIGPGQLMTTFNRFVDQTGHLDRKGLRKVVKELDVSASQQELNAVMWDLDAEGNGEISPEGQFSMEES